MANIKQKIKENPVTTILAIVTLGNVVVGIILGIITNQLKPLAQDIMNVKAEENRLEQEIQVNTVSHEKLVNLETFNAVVTRIDHISSRVDSIYSIVANK